MKHVSVDEHEMPVMRETGQSWKNGGVNRLGRRKATGESFCVEAALHGNHIISYHIISNLLKPLVLDGCIDKAGCARLRRRRAICSGG